MPVSPVALARFKRLALRSSDVWQGGIVRFPAWIQEDKEQPPQRLRGVFWFSTRTGLIWAHPVEVPQAPGGDLALRGLLDFAKKYGRELLGRPSRIEMTDAALADELRAALDDPATTIAVVPDLPNVREALRAFEQYQTDSDRLPASLLDSPGVTLERLRSFADAAALFYEANIWDLLDPEEDLVAIDQPVDPALRFLIVTGSTRDVRGLTFFAASQQYDRFLVDPPRPGRPKPRVWILSFDPLDWLPFGDVDAWTDHGLPVGAADAYPRPGLVEPDGGLTRPDAARLAFLEAVLRALAASNDDDFNSGRWTRTVETATGPVEVRLSMPRLLEAIAAGSRGAGEAGPVSPKTPERLMRIVRKAVEASGTASLDEVRKIVGSIVNAPEADAVPKASPATPLEQAQDFAFAAMETEGRYQTHLARRALAISRDCADARTILGHRARTPAAAMAFYREAVAAGERALGPGYFEEHGGHFWGLLETRPYMRARRALADAFESDGHMEEAVTHYRELIRLNPNDNQGARHMLLTLLLEQDRDGDARSLLDQFEVDEGTTWLYAQALVAFRLLEKDSGERLDRAIAANRHVPPFLACEKEIPDVPAFFAPGSREDAAITADLLLDVWNNTPGAVFWLNTRRRQARTSGRRTRKAKKRD